MEFQDWLEFSPNPKKVNFRAIEKITGSGEVYPWDPFINSPRTIRLELRVCFGVWGARHNAGGGDVRGVTGYVHDTPRAASTAQIFGRKNSITTPLEIKKSSDLGHFKISILIILFNFSQFSICFENAMLVWKSGRKNSREWLVFPRLHVAQLRPQCWWW